MSQVIKINTITITIDKTPYIRQISGLLTKEGDIMVICPIESTEKEIILYLSKNWNHIIGGFDVDGWGNHTKEKDVAKKQEAKVKKTSPTSDISELMKHIKIFYNPFYNKIRFYSNDQNSISVVCPDSTRKEEIRRYLIAHKDEIKSILSSKKPNKHKPQKSVPQRKDYASLIRQLKAPTPKPIPTEEEPKDDCLMLVEGYKVYRFLVNVRWEYINAKIVNKSDIHVFVSSYYYNNIPFIKNYIEEKLDKMIKDHVDYIRKSHIHTDNRLIEKGTFSYTQRRSDITDEEPLKVLKHKRKSSVTSPVKTQEYIGETRANLIGSRAISHDGRLVTFERGEDYGLIDKND